ncbi:MAG: hypothetical protein KC503_00355 [Myxococcales bacterium]|nr:hypothetical protein [Myxococcales bacterium]
MKRSIATLSTLLILITFTLVACGGEDGDNNPPPKGSVGEKDAKVVQSDVAAGVMQINGVAQADLSSLFTSLAAGAAPFSGKLFSGSVSDLANLANTGLDINSLVDGALGGAMKLSGNIKALGALPIPSGLPGGLPGGLPSFPGFKLDLDAELAKLAGAAGTVLDGKLKITHTINAIAPLDVDVSVTGDLSVGGVAAGSARVDITMSIDDKGALVCGTVAGYDVSTGACP